MHVFDPTILGIIVLVLPGALAAVKRLTTGAVLDKLSGDLSVRFINGFDLFCLVAVNPLDAILCITGRWGMVDSSVFPWAGLFSTVSRVVRALRHSPGADHLPDTL